MLRDVGLPFIGGADPDIIDVTEASGKVQPGWLFVAVPGGTTDGHAFIPEAEIRGAAAIMAERPAPTNVPLVIVPSTRAALADCAAAVHGFPSRRLRVLGVTGTDGKTSTSFFLAGILAAAGQQVGLSTTVETRVGGRATFNQDRMTTPDAATMQRLLAGMVAAGDQYAVIESSSHALAQDRLRGIQYRGAVLTNIANDHLDFHGTHQAYVAAKARLFSMVAQSTAPHIALNRDDPSLEIITPRLDRSYLSYGLSAGCDIRGEAVELGVRNAAFTLTTPLAKARIALPMTGEFNVYNALAASALAFTEGVPIEAVRRGLEETRPPPGRLERIDLGQDFTVIIDYAHTVQAFGQVLSLVRRQADDLGSRVIAVFGAAGSRDRSKRPVFGQIAGELTDYFVITNEDPFGEQAQAIADEIAAGAPHGERRSAWTIELDRRRAIELALSRARPGDIVVITGKGHERSISEGAVSTPWSDTAVVRGILADMAQLGVAGT